MNKIFTVLLMMCVGLMGGTAWAKTVNERQALKIANGFMTSRAIPAGGLRMAHKAPMMKAPGQSEKAAYYAFNASRGYVIVAGDDRAPAVLGYSDKGTFDPNNIPEAMQELLESYAEQIGSLDSGVKVAAHLTATNPIAPLITAQWDQTEPYNLLFPNVRNQRAFVGCVATAMAQIMYYWKWPARPSGPIPAYTSATNGIYMPQLPVVNFDWDSMQDTYQSDDTSDGAYAASRLSLYCAQSVEMDFTRDGSGAMTYKVPVALYSLFNYSISGRFMQRGAYNTTAWEGMIIDELAAHRPVLYSGSKRGGGHAFVCDGYDGNGRFHINWGWNGVSNGYFLLNVLDPYTQGAGSAAGSYGYIESQGMAIGIQPSNGTETPPPLEVTVTGVEVKSYTETRTSSTYNFSLSQVTTFMNCMNRPISFDYGWGFYDSSNRLIKTLSTGFINTMGIQYFISPTQTLLFGSGRSSGVYRIIPIYSERNTNNWKPCVGSGVNHIKVVINNNKCTVTAQGAYGTPSYEVNSISVTGNMHPRRPVNITLNVTNNGNTRNDLIYMFANGNFVSESYVDLDKGTSGKVEFQYTKSTSGTVDLTFSLNPDGSDPIATQTIVIEPMPAAQLSGTIEVQNVVDEWRNWILDDKFSLNAKVTNNGTETYNEDITVYLYKSLMGYYGTPVQSVTRTVSISPGKSINVDFDLDNVVDGWTYAVEAYYYSQGRDKLLDLTGNYTIYFTETPTIIRGDVNLDGEVNIADVNAVISVIMGTVTDPNILWEADVDGNGEINIGDVNAIISIILG